MPNDLAGGRRSTAQPLVSVVTPVYNGEAFLAECIESVLRQTYPHWEYVIMDNRSDDRTGPIAEGYAAGDERIRYVRKDDFVDVGRSFNRAVAEMSGDATFLKLLCADDLLFPRCLESMVAVATANPGVGLIGAYRLDDTRVTLDGLPHGRQVFPGVEVCYQNLTDGPYVTGSNTSTMVRADFARKPGGFYDETFLHFDTEACFAILAQSDFGFAHEVLTFTRRHDGANTPFTLASFSYASEHLRMFVKYGPKVMPEGEYRRRLHGEIRRFGWLMTKQTIKLRPWREPRFREFHIAVLARLEHELDTASDRAVIRACRLTLESGRALDR